MQEHGCQKQTEVQLSLVLERLITEMRIIGWSGYFPSPLFDELGSWLISFLNHNSQQSEPLRLKGCAPTVCRAMDSISVEMRLHSGGYCASLHTSHTCSFLYSFISLTNIRVSFYGAMLVITIIKLIFLRVSPSSEWIGDLWVAWFIWRVVELCHVEA